MGKLIHRKVMTDVIFQFMLLLANILCRTNGREQTLLGV